MHYAPSFHQTEQAWVIIFMTRKHKYEYCYHDGDKEIGRHQRLPGRMVSNLMDITLIERAECSYALCGRRSCKDKRHTLP